MKSRHAALVAILVAAAALRFWGIDDRLPDPSLGINPLDDSAIEETDRTTMGRAWTMWGGGSQRLDPNPHTGGWPALSFYLTLAIQILYRGWWQVRGGGGGTEAFVQHVQVDPDAIFFFARAFGCLIGVLTVWLTYRVARKTLAPVLALLAAAFLGVNPLHVATSQHISDPNLLALMFVLLACLPMTRIGPGARVWPSILCGVMIGLGGGSKYVPLVLVVPLIWSHYEWWRSTPTERTRSLACFLLACASVVAAFFASSPFLLLDFSSAMGGIRTQVADFLTEWTGQGGALVALPTYLIRTIPAAVGWPAFIVGAIGLVGLSVRKTTFAALALTPVVLILSNGLLRVAQERYILPAVPFFFVGTAFVAGRLADILIAHRSKLLRPLAIASLIGLVVIPALTQVVSVRRALALPDTRHLSRRWLNQNLPPSMPAVVELYGPVVNSLRMERLAVTWPFYAVGPARVRPAYHSEFLDGFRCYVTSNEVSRRYLAQAKQYPVEAEFYRWLSHESRTVWVSDSIRASGPQIEIRQLPGAISTPGRRDSIWSVATAVPIDSTRIGAWCLDLSRVFVLADDFARAGEWATRGLDVVSGTDRIETLRSLSYASVRKGDATVAEGAAREGIGLAPTDEELHLYRGMALQQMGRTGEALVEYETSLRLAPRQEGWNLLEAEINRLKQEKGK